MFGKKADAGTAFILIIIIVIMIIIGVVYTMMAMGWSTIFDETNDKLTGEAKESQEKVNWTINQWPIYALVVILLFGLWKVLERKTPYGYQ